MAKSLRQISDGVAARREAKGRRALARREAEEEKRDQAAFKRFKAEVRSACKAAAEKGDRRWTCTREATGGLVSLARRWVEGAGKAWAARNGVRIEVKSWEAEMGDSAAPCYVRGTELALAW